MLDRLQRDADRCLNQLVVLITVEESSRYEHWAPDWFPRLRINRREDHHNPVIGKGASVPKHDLANLAN
jgi:hypothetical protein